MTYWYFTFKSIPLVWIRYCKLNANVRIFNCICIFPQVHWPIWPSTRLAQFRSSAQRKLFSESWRHEETLRSTGSFSTPPSSGGLEPRTREGSPDTSPTSAPLHPGKQISWYIFSFWNVFTKLWCGYIDTFCFVDQAQFSVRAFQENGGGYRSIQV